jgi:hypothetical protein
MLEEAKLEQGTGSEKSAEKYLKSYEKYKEKVKKLKFFKKEGINSIDDISNLGAFVTFDKFEDKEKLRDLWADLNKFRLCKKTIWPEKHIFQGEKLTIDFDPDEPSNVKWENLDVKPLEAFLRGIVVKLVLFSVLLLMIFALILNN